MKILAVNKKDLLDEDEDSVQVTQEAVERTRDCIGATVFSVSAKTNEKVNDIFEFARLEVRKRFPGKKEEKEEEPEAHDSADENPHHCCCCY